MLKAGWGRAGRAAADGRRVAQAAAARNQRRQESPMLEQRPEPAAPTRRRRAAPLAPCGRYSRALASLRFTRPFHTGAASDTRPFHTGAAYDPAAAAGDACGWRGAPARRTDCA